MKIYHYRSLGGPVDEYLVSHQNAPGWTIFSNDGVLESPSRPGGSDLRQTGLV